MAKTYREVAIEQMIATVEEAGQRSDRHKKSPLRQSHPQWCRTWRPISASNHQLIDRVTTNR
jgi:hypothetical protein